jgi:hypothetical protein
MSMRDRLQWILVVVGVTVSTGALAQYDYDSPMMRHADFYSHTFHQKFLNDLVDPLKGSRKKPSATALSSGTGTGNAGAMPARLAAASTQAPAVGGAGSSSVPRKMASDAPPAARVEVEKVFSQLLSEYPKFERQSGFPANDLGGAVASFVAGSWMAYRDRDLPDAHFATLAAQVRGMIGNNSQLANASPQERREVYEQMAILGLYMALTREGLKRSPNPLTTANLRNAAKRYLEDFLKTDADRIQITAQGLAFN